MTTATAPNDLFVNRLAELFGNPDNPLPPDPKLEPESGRDAQGKFRNGNRGGPGNPFGRRVAKLRQAMLEECAEEDLRAMTRAMIERAKNGDAAAARLVFQYALGKPAKSVDPDRIDQDEWDVLQSMAVPAKNIQPTLEMLPADAANRLVQKLWPLFVQLFANTIRTEAARVAEIEKQMKEAEAEWERMSPEERERIEAAFRAAGAGPNVDQHPATGPATDPATDPAAPAVLRQECVAPPRNERREQREQRGEAPSPNGACPSPNGIFSTVASRRGNGVPQGEPRPDGGAPQRGK